MNYKFLYIILLIFYGCTEETIIPEPEPPAPETPPGDFTVSVTEITDVTALVKWTQAVDPEADAVAYDVALGDSVVSYNRTSLCLLQGLQPDTLYTVRVIALDPQRNETVRTTEFHTRKAWIRKIFTYDLGYNDCRFFEAIETRDDGLFIYGLGTGSNTGRGADYFFLKLNAEYQVEWIRLKYLEDEARALLESSDLSYYIIFTSFILKLDSQGNEQWEFAYPDWYYAYLKDITEGTDGNIIVTGASIDKSQKDGRGAKYFVSKITPGKNELWTRMGSGALTVDAAAVLAEDNGCITIHGSAPPGDASILHLDQDGQFIKEYIFPGDYYGTDIGIKFIRSDLEGYFLFGSVSIFDGYNFRPRFLKVDHTGHTIWDEYPDTLYTGGFPKLEAIDEMGNGEFLVLTHNSGGNQIASITPDGGLGFCYTMNGYPAGDLIKYDKDSNYVFVSSRGQIFIFNHDGYFDAF